MIAVCTFAAFGGFLLLNSLYLQGCARMVGVPRRCGPAAGCRCCDDRLAIFRPPRRQVRGPTFAAGERSHAHIERAIAVATAGTDAGCRIILDLRALRGRLRLMVNAPVTFAAVSGMPRAQAGVASAVASTSRQIGVSVGVALAGALAGSPVGNGDAFARATHSFWWVLVGFGVVIIVLALWSTGARARASVERIAHLLQEPGAGAAGMTARYGAKPRSKAEGTWRLLVELVMETRGDWRRAVSEATGLALQPRARTLASRARCSHIERVGRRYGHRRARPPP